MKSLLFVVPIFTVSCNKDDDTVRGLFYVFPVRETISIEKTCTTCFLFPVEDEQVRDECPTGNIPHAAGIRVPLPHHRQNRQNRQGEFVRLPDGNSDTPSPADITFRDNHPGLSVSICYSGDMTWY